MNEKQPRVRRIAFKTLTGNCFNCDLLAFFVVNAYDRQYLVRIKANPLHVFPFLLFVLFCLSFFVLAVCLRCECGICQPMPTAHESVCYTEISRDSLKKEDQRPEIQMSCITQHPGFRSSCLDVWVLETAYYAFRQQYGADNHTAHEYVHFLD